MPSSWGTNATNSNDSIINNYKLGEICPSKDHRKESSPFLGLAPQADCKQPSTPTNCFMVGAAAFHGETNQDKQHAITSRRGTTQNVLSLRGVGEHSVLGGSQTSIKIQVAMSQSHSAIRRSKTFGGLGTSLHSSTNTMLLDYPTLRPRRANAAPATNTGAYGIGGLWSGPTTWGLKGLT